MFEGHTSRWQMIPGINRAIQQMTQEEHVTYIDLFSHFADEQGQMKTEYTNDGLHLLGKGYLLWKTIITPYIKNSHETILCFAYSLFLDYCLDAS